MWSAHALAREAVGIVLTVRSNRLFPSFARQYDTLSERFDTDFVGTVADAKSRHHEHRAAQQGGETNRSLRQVRQTSEKLNTAGSTSSGDWCSIG